MTISPCGRQDPALYDRQLDPGDWYPSYIATYVERDVRSVLAIGDLQIFQTFLRLAAGRTSQLMNASALAADAGVAHNTARAWLTVLEAGYVAWRLPPFFSNLGKRLVKTPKLHFVDTGLVCSLLGIRSAEQLREHPLRGAIFETFVAAEILKARRHRGLQPDLFFYRDRKGVEVDLIVEDGPALLAIETKSGQTIASDFFTALSTFSGLVGAVRPPRVPRNYLVYGGAESQSRSVAEVVSWSDLDRCAWWPTEDA